MGSMSFLARANKLGMKHGITGVGCSGNYLTTNEQGKPVTLSKSSAAFFEKRVEEKEAEAKAAAEKKNASQAQVASPQL